MLDNNRKGWLDMGRGISILLVILYHSENTIGLSWFHWSVLASPFRMPLFFFISGYLYTGDVLSFSMRRKLSQILRGIVVPYFIFTSVLIVPKVFYHGIDIDEGIREIFLGWASWFVVALCGAQIIFGIIFYFTRDFKKLFILSVLLYCGGIGMHYMHFERIPFYLNYSLMISPFFLLGILYRHEEKHIDRLIGIKWRTFIIILALYVSIILLDTIYLHTDLSLFDDGLTEYHNILVSITYSVVGIMLMVIFLKKTTEVKPIMTIGRYSLVFYYLNGGVLKLVKIFMFKCGLRQWTNEIPEYVRVMGLLCISTFVLNIICLGIRKYVPLLIGDKKAYGSLTSHFCKRTTFPIRTDELKYFRLVEIIMMILVVMIHVPRLHDDIYFESFQKIIPHGICQIAAPTFFLIGGYLFVPENVNVDSCISKFRNGMKSLVIPYFVWNIVAILILVLPHINQYSDINLWNAFMLFWDTSKSFLHTTGTGPIDFPLWFVRDLTICVVCFPAVYVAIKYSSWVLPLCLTMCWISRIDNLGLNLISISFFSIGVWFRIRNYYLFDYGKILYLLSAICVVGITLNAIHPIISIFRMGIVCGAFASFPAVRIIFNRFHIICNKCIDWLNPGGVFFIYCFHAIVITHVADYVLTTLNAVNRNLSSGDEILYFFTTVTITITVSICIFRYCLPNALKWLTVFRSNA